MDLEAMLEAVFGFRDYLDDTDMATNLREHLLDEDEQKKILSSWFLLGMIDIVQYISHDEKKVRSIYFRPNMYTRKLERPGHDPSTRVQRR